MKQRMIIGYDDGTTDTASLRGMRAVAKYRLNSAVQALWREQAHTEVEMGENLWGLASGSGSVYLTGIIRPPTSKQILWACIDNGHPPEVYHPYSINRFRQEALQSRFAKQREFVAAQEAFTRQGYSGNWIDYESSEVVFQAFRSRNRRRRVASLFAKSGHGCGDYYGAAMGIVMLKKNQPVFLGAPTDQFLDSFVDDSRALVAIDMDRDGFPEFVGHQKVYYRRNNKWKTWELRIPLDTLSC